LSASSIESAGGKGFVIGQPNFTTAGTSTSDDTFNTPIDVKLDGGGDVFVSDGGNNRGLLSTASGVST